jgi:hypothetical protein
MQHLGLGQTLPCNTIRTKNRYLTEHGGNLMIDPIMQLDAELEWLGWIADEQERQVAICTYSANVDRVVNGVGTRP